MVRQVFISVSMTAAGALALAAASAPVATAQDAAPASAAQTSQKATAQKAPAQKAAPSSAVGGGDAALRQRVEQLEEQIVDMQVVIGTLESLAKAPPQSGSSAAPRNSGATGGVDTARVDSLEQQLKALTAQMQQMSSQGPAQRGDRRSELPIGSPPASGQSAVPQADSAGTVSSFGSTTVTSGQSDAIGGLLANNSAPQASAPPPKAGESLPDIPGANGQAGAGVAIAPPAQIAALPPGDGGGDPQQMYSSAYGFLLGQNYGAAQSGFEEFLRKNPRDALAPDALFWLGEAHYMQKNYGDAAEAFDLVTASYSASSKAPEAQLRRAASLVQLGRRDDACAALRQLGTKYPNARAVLKAKADAERQRAGCT